MLWDFQSFRKFNTRFEKNQHCEYCKIREKHPYWFHSPADGTMYFLTYRRDYNFNGDTDMKAFSVVLKWILQKFPGAEDFPNILDIRK